MRNFIILPLVVMVLTASCQNVDIRKKMQEDYKNSLHFFRDELVNHFPNELPDTSSYGATVPKQDTFKLFGFGADGIFLWKTYSLSKYNSITAKYEDLTNVSYKSTDSSLLLVFSYCDVIEIDGKTYKDQETPERQALAKHNVTTANSMPVPLFEIDEYKGNTISGLTEDFKIYVLEAKPGKYIDEKYLQECDCLPEKWKHGYSKGIALNDKRQVVIYWVIVW